ncbi:DUF2076 domain-containing protein [Rhodopila sp.]|jgi:hypothetical protein|uniref:DUF2076 domain-containing protein n=1 Tax=Rhodopila sp. TaxID=2480087 RepID=UPI002CA2BFF2|nr:DUF2076 family protein [Rhodopila sp.]HVZ08637.1 DUF2076 family protein [Rhodopila sp.]
MTDEERQIISQFVARVGGSPASSGFASGSVPQTQPALPPVDREADQFIAQQFQQYPEARYRITQLAFVQEHALVEAQNRIQRLEWEKQQMQQALQQAQQAAQQQGSSGGGFFSGLFGGGRQSQPQAAPPPGGPWGQTGPQRGPQQGYYPPPPPPQYPPGYQPGVFQRQGSGFLGSALTTAAGVAGGVLAANALTSLFSGGHSAAGFGAGGVGAGAASPWATPVPDQQQFIDNSAWDPGAAGAGGQDFGGQDFGAGAANQDYLDNGGWDSSGGGVDDSGSWDSGNTDDTF